MSWDEVQIITHALWPLLLSSLPLPPRQSFQNSSNLTWFVRTRGMWSPQLLWCCFRNWRGSTNSSVGWASLSATCRRWGHRSSVLSVYVTRCFVEYGNEYVYLQMEIVHFLQFLVNTESLYLLQIFQCNPWQALAGEVGMSVELDELAKSLYNGQIPSIWRVLAPATLKTLGNWMIHFLKRNQQYLKWVSCVGKMTKCQPIYLHWHDNWVAAAVVPSWYISFIQVNEGEPYVMWLSGLHIPESYLTALVQATCRKNGWPLDKSTLYTSVTEVWEILKFL